MKAIIEAAAMQKQSSGKTKLKDSTSDRVEEGEVEDEVVQSWESEEIPNNTNVRRKKVKTHKKFFKLLESLEKIPQGMKSWAAEGQTFHTPSEDSSWSIQQSEDGVCLEYHGNIVATKGKEESTPKKPLILVHIQKDKGLWLALSETRDLRDATGRLAVGVKSIWSNKTVKPLLDLDMHREVAKDGKTTMKLGSGKFPPFPGGYKSWMLESKEAPRATGATASQEDGAQKIEAMQVEMGDESVDAGASSDLLSSDIANEDTQVPEKGQETRQEARATSPQKEPQTIQPAKKATASAGAKKPAEQRPDPFDSSLFPILNQMQVERVDPPTVDLTEEEIKDLDSVKSGPIAVRDEWMKKNAPKLDEEGKVVLPTVQERRTKQVENLLNKLKAVDGDKLATEITAQLAKDPKVMNEASELAKSLREEKLKGDFLGVSTELLKKSEGNVLRDLNPTLVADKKESIKDMGWYEHCTMIGCVEEKDWPKLEKVLKKGEKISQASKGLIEVLDGQHRLKALEELLRERVLKEMPKVHLLVYVGLTSDEKRVVSVVTDLINTSLAETTMVDLLKQMRDYWLELVYDQKKTMMEAEKMITIRFQHQMASKIKGSASSKEVKKVIPKEGVKVKVKAKGKEAEEKILSEQVVLGNMLSAMHYKLKYAYQVPLETNSIWPMWYRHLKKQEELTAPYSQEHFVEMASMQWPLRKFAMAFACIQKLPAANFRTLCRFLKGHEIMSSWFNSEVVEGSLAKQQLVDTTLTGQDATQRIAAWTEFFKQKRGFDALSMVGSSNRFDPKAPELTYLAEQILKSISMPNKPTPEDVLKYYLIWSIKPTTKPDLLLDKVALSVNVGLKWQPPLEFETVHTLLVDLRYSQNGASSDEMGFRGTVVKTAVSKGLLVVCLCDDSGLATVYGYLHEIKVRRFHFPVLKSKGYVQHPDQPSGGTGLFVLVLAPGGSKLDLFRDCEVENYIPSVGFCKAANAFHLTDAESRLSWPANWIKNGLVPETETVPQEFFSSLPLFFKTKHNSVTLILCASQNDGIVFAGRSLLESRRRVVFLGSEGRKEVRAKLVSACAVVACTSTEVFQKPASIAQLAEFLPPSSSFRKKVLGMTFLDRIIQDPNCTEWEQLEKSIVAAYEEEGWKSIVPSLEAERKLFDQWRAKHPGPYTGVWASQMRSPGFLDGVESKRITKEFREQDARTSALSAEKKKKEREEAQARVDEKASRLQEKKRKRSILDDSDEEESERDAKKRKVVRPEGSSGEEKEEASGEEEDGEDSGAEDD